MTLTELCNLYNTLVHDYASALMAQRLGSANMTVAKRLHAEALLIEWKETSDTILHVYEKFKTSDSPNLSKEAIDALSNFLAERDKEITCGALGYTAEPKSPANQFCKALAEKLYAYKKTNNELEVPQEPKNKALYRILMPSLNITGVHSLFLDQEDDGFDLPEYGTFLLTDDLLNDRRGSIISFDRVLNESENLYFFCAYVLFPSQSPHGINKRQKNNQAS